MTLVDLSPEMVRLASRRVDQAGVRAELAVMDAEHLDAPPATFRVVLCGFGIFFLPEPTARLDQFRREGMERIEAMRVDGEVRCG